MYSKKARNREKVLDLLRSGMSSCDEIAKAAGVTKQVVMGIKGAWAKGSYMNELGPKPKKPVRMPAVPVTSWCYLILSHKGEVYLGATTDIRHRFRTHNSATNKGYTKGRRWHLLATRKFPTRKEAFH